MKTMIIIGMGPGLSMGLAIKFGREGYRIGMISRNGEKLEAFKRELRAESVDSVYATADAADTVALIGAVRELASTLGQVDLLIYNAVDYRMKNILEENIEDLTNGFKISVGNALEAVKALLPELQQSKGSILLTGGASAFEPNPDLATISLGKAGIRNLALQLHGALKQKGIFVGTVTIDGWIKADSATHSPELIAEKFWQLHQARSERELVY